MNQLFALRNRCEYVSNITHCQSDKEIDRLTTHTHQSCALLLNDLIQSTLTDQIYLQPNSLDSRKLRLSRLEVYFVQRKRLKMGHFAQSQTVFLVRKKINLILIVLLSIYLLLILDAKMCPIKFSILIHSFIIVFCIRFRLLPMQSFTDSTKDVLHLQ